MQRFVAAKRNRQAVWSRPDPLTTSHLIAAPFRHGRRIALGGLAALAVVLMLSLVRI
jgi:hypothetical protein